MQQAVTVSSRPQDAYRKQNVLTASPLELVVMLYDALKKNLVLGQRKIAKYDINGAHNCLMKAHDIVDELVGSLDMSYQMSEELLALYEFMLRNIEDANVRKDPAPLEVVIEMVDELRGAWHEISVSSKGSLHMGDEMA